MTTRAYLLAGIAALLAVPAAAQVSDYRLPPAPTPTPTPPPVVGPVLGNGPALRPTPSPTPTPAPPPTVTVPPAPAPTPIPQISVPAVKPGLAPSPIRHAAPTPTPSPVATPTAAPAIAPSVSPAPAPSAAQPSFTPVAPEVIAPESQGRSYWPWIVFVFLLGGGGFAAFLWLRRRVGPAGPVVVPEIERPKVPAELDLEPFVAEPPKPLAAKPPAAAETDPLQITIELRKVTITLMNATLSYRLILTNAGVEPIKDIAVAADLIGAHSSLPREAQVAGPTSQLPERHRLAGIAPGERGELTGELRIPLSELRPITRGKAVLFVPLVRFRIGARERPPRWFTLVTGQPSSSGNGAVQPVRLDLGPRIYDGLAGRAF